MSRPRGPRRRRRRGAPAPPLHAAPPASSPGLQRAPPALFPGRGCASRRRGRAARRGGGRRGPAARGGHRHPFPRAAGALRGAGTREKRAVGEGARCCGERELCTRRSPVHLARPPLPPEPEPGPGLWGAGRGTGCGDRGEWGTGWPLQPGEVLEVRGMGRNPAIRPYSSSAFLLAPLRR